MKTPNPSMAFAQDVAQYNEPPLVSGVSGEFTLTQDNMILGTPKFAGRISDVFLSIKDCGTDITNALNISGEVYINGTTCLSTTPKIAGVSGEAGAQKTTIVTGDTAVVQAVINPAANSYSPGDVITGSILIQRTGSPDTEMESPVLAVDLFPDFPVAPK